MEASGRYRRTCLGYCTVERLCTWRLGSKASKAEVMCGQNHLKNYLQRMANIDHGFVYVICMYKCIMYSIRHNVIESTAFQNLASQNIEMCVGTK